LISNKQQVNGYFVKQQENTDELLK
jgi:hypothetical protein